MKWTTLHGEISKPECEPSEIQRFMEEHISHCCNSEGSFELVSRLPLKLQAFVTRREDREIVHVRAANKNFEIDRGNFSVSCDPRGQRVPVESINIEFRDIKDTCTDRGIVWVWAEYDGHSIATLRLYKAVLQEGADSVETILAQAEAAVRREILDRLDRAKPTNRPKTKKS